MQDTSARVLHFDKHEGYVEYQIQISVGELDWKIRRRFNDFLNLDNQLRRDGYDLPSSLPPKSMFDRFNEDFLRDRMEKLDIWLCQTIEDVPIVSSQALSDFLEWGARRREFELLERLEGERRAAGRARARAVAEAVAECQKKESVKQDLWMSHIMKEKSAVEELEVQVAELKANLEITIQSKNEAEETAEALRSELALLKETVSTLQMEKGTLEGKLEISRNVISQLRNSRAGSLDNSPTAAGGGGQMNGPGWVDDVGMCSKRAVG
mmetsp:Transcript_42811/g.66940  ORF Transcript_42811/g.66940 Transcript_42811/m.66940 type:complete len:267 (+) Transcript_42811:132-932(+)